MRWASAIWFLDYIFTHQGLDDIWIALIKFFFFEFLNSIFYKLFSFCSELFDSPIDFSIIFGQTKVKNTVPEYQSQRICSLNSDLFQDFAKKYWKSLPIYILVCKAASKEAFTITFENIPLKTSRRCDWITSFGESGF